MVGGFGLLNDASGQTPFPPKRLVETYPVLDVHQLYRAGALTEGTETRIEIGGKGSQLAFCRGRNLEIDGQRIPILPHPVAVVAFACPLEGRPCYRLYCVDGVWGSRKAHKLDWSSRHKHRTIRGLARLAWLRRRAGVSPVPFSDLPQKGRQWRRYWRLALEIRALEARLVGHLRDDVVAVVKRRHERRY
jgi:hypothetical protein